MCPSRLQVVFLAEGPMVQDLSRVAFMHMEISFPGPVAGDYEQYRAKVRHFLTEHRGIVRRDSLVGDIEGHGIIMMRVKRMWDGRWRGTSAGLYSGLTEVLVTCAQGPLEGSPKVVLLGGRAGPVPWGIPLRVFRGAQQHDDVVMPMCTGMQLSRDPGAIAALRVELLGSWLPVVSGEPPGCHVHGRPGGGVPSQAGHPARDAKRRVANGCFPPSLALRPALFDAVFPDAGASLVEAPCNLRYLEEAGSFATVE
ncbi:hypothetical protein H696_06070 [Fonticula alba]|uniref:Uncharacterized protein n=1 Tax=Fonticula alba TaxID=691883 RepID=A0A058Z0A8_FONAL|nr:hypothetical protein H696_06070 [Fonticula alba]KCV67551.1 hypothetical protein H696_06070 [Fonticula alba]|eukprot:XP_009498112.1 hypothetical protein H696_06070 [Fonticula alba]